MVVSAHAQYKCGQNDSKRSQIGKNLDSVRSRG